MEYEKARDKVKELSAEDIANLSVKDKDKNFVKAIKASLEKGEEIKLSDQRKLKKILIASGQLEEDEKNKKGSKSKSKRTPEEPADEERRDEEGAEEVHPEPEKSDEEHPEPEKSDEEHPEPEKSEDEHPEPEKPDEEHKDPHVEDYISEEEKVEEEEYTGLPDDDPSKKKKGTELSDDASGKGPDDHSKE